MRGRSIAFAIVVAFIAALPAAAQFKEIRRAVDREIGGHRIYVPFKGIARLYVKAANPEGVHDIQFAVYEGARSAQKGKIESIFREHLGKEWRPFVRVESHRDGEEVVIYAREGEDGETVDMMLFAGDEDETVLMLTTLDIDKFLESMDDPHHYESR